MTDPALFRADHQLTERLFQDEPHLAGCIRCQACGELFVKVARLEELRTSLGVSTKAFGLSQPEQETIRRLKHGREHVARHEAILDRKGFFRLVPEKASLTAKQHGFLK